MTLRTNNDLLAGAFTLLGYKFVGKFEQCKYLATVEHCSVDTTVCSYTLVEPALDYRALFSAFEHESILRLPKARVGMHGQSTINPLNY